MEINVFTINYNNRKISDETSENKVFQKLMQFLKSYSWGKINEEVKELIASARESKSLLNQN